MYCDDCGSALKMDVEDYMKTVKEERVVLCDDCRGPRKADLTPTVVANGL